MNHRVFFFILGLIFGSEIEAQITPNKVDSLGLKQGMWREFKVPTNLATEEIGIKAPKLTSEYFYLTKDKDRKYFPIIECIGEYKDGLKTGEWVEYYGNGYIKNQIQYKEGVPLGICKEYWGDGVLKSIFNITSKDSILITSYNPNGDLEGKTKVPKVRVIKEIYEN
jgi:antitoxin component YwqK of YwqJK toxin-antitoxin module